jgi:hypothetical protein
MADSKLTSPFRFQYLELTTPYRQNLCFPDKCAFSSKSTPIFAVQPLAQNYLLSEPRRFYYFAGNQCLPLRLFNHETVARRL